jgi:cyclase
VGSDRRRLVACTALLVVSGWATVSGAEPGYRLEKVADGVYCATSRETAYVVANSVVVVGEESVLVVDSGASPSGARRLAQAIRTVSDRPIRYLVDTHFHFDHAFGNGAFDGAAPRIDLRAHATRFPPLAGPGFDPTAVRRIYEVLDEREARP